MKKFLLLLTFMMSQGLIAALIHDAVNSGDIDEVNRILSQNSSSRDLGGNDVNAFDRFGYTPIYTAVSSGNAKIVEMLIIHGADVNAVNIHGTTSLHLAVCDGHTNIVEILIGRGADVDAVNRHCMIPLQIAAIRGDEEIAEILIRHGADVNAIDNDGRTTLHWATINGHAEIVEMLIRHGAYISTPNNRRETPLHLASINGNANIVGILIRHGANINAVNDAGWTPLHSASFWGCENVVRILLEDPLCDHTITDNDNYTPERVARSRGNQRIVDMLHNAPSVEQKLVKSERNDVLQRLAARVANKEGVYEEDYDKLGTSFRHYITNIRKDKQQKRCSIQ